jgi:hypothetical protein
MRKFIFVLLIVLISCGATEETVDNVDNLATLPSSSTSSTQPEATTTTLAFEEMEKIYLNYYFENKISGYLTLSSEEIEITKNLKNKYPTFFIFDDLSCYSRERGTIHNGLLNEYFQVYEDNEYYFFDYWTVENEGEKFVYSFNNSYSCKLISDDSEYPEYIYLYGYPFFYEGKWWIYKDVEVEPVPVDTPYLVFWAERVELKDFQQVYEEWVLDAIEPQVLINNCPEQTITESSYDVSWSIISGNADIDYLFIGYYKNGEYDTRVFFEKDQNPDAFPYPLANTTNIYSTPVENTGDTGITTQEILIQISDEYKNYAEASCIITFEK